jgi:hypothetical protein
MYFCKYFKHSVYSSLIIQPITATDVTISVITIIIITTLIIIIVCVNIGILIIGNYDYML